VGVTPEEAATEHNRKEDYSLLSRISLTASTHMPGTKQIWAMKGFHMKDRIYLVNTDVERRIVSGMIDEITVRNGHGNLDFYGKFTKLRLCSFVHSMGKKSHKCVGIFIIDAMVILPYLKIYHEKNIFLVNLP
jgi:hypothetical protein